MAEISITAEVMEILSDKYLFTNIPSNFNDLDDQMIINIYLRIITVYDDINEYLQSDSNAHSSGESSQDKKLILKHIFRCIRPFDFSYLVPKTVCLLDRKKTLRIFSALHNEVQKRYGKALFQRVRIVMKREEIRNKNLHRKLGKMDSLPDTCSSFEASCGTYNAEKNITTVESFIRPKDLTLLTPSKPSSNLNYIIPKGRQIPRTPFKLEKDAENMNVNGIMPPPSDFSDRLPDLNISTECLSPPPEFGDVKFVSEQPIQILSPPEKYKDTIHSTAEHMGLVFEQKEDNYKEAMCSSNNISKVLRTELECLHNRKGNAEDFTGKVCKNANSTQTLINSSVCDLDSDTDSKKSCQLLSNYADACNIASNPEPKNISNCKVRRDTYCIPTDHSNSPVNDSELNSPICNLGIDNNDRLSDVAPVMFMDDVNLNNSSELITNSDTHKVIKSRETYVVPQPLKSRETFVVPQPFNSRETYAVPHPLKSRETFVVPQPFKSRETFLISQPLSSFDDSINDEEGNLSQSVLETNNSLKFDVMNNGIVNLKGKNGTETIIQKIKVSPDLTTTTITEINYTGNKTVRHFPKGKELLRTPPSSDSSFADKSTNLDNTLNRSRNDLLVQIYLNKSNLNHLSEKNDLPNARNPEELSKLDTTYTSGSEESSILDITNTSGSQELSKLDATNTSASESERDLLAELNDSLHYDDSLSIFPSKSFKTPRSKLITTDNNVENVDNVNRENKIKTKFNEKITMDDELKVPERSGNDSQNISKEKNKIINKKTNLKMEESYGNKIMEPKEKLEANVDENIKLTDSTENGSQEIAELLSVESNRKESSVNLKEIPSDNYSKTLENAENNKIKVLKEGSKRIKKRDNLKLLESNEKESLGPDRKLSTLDENLKIAEIGQKSQKVMKEQKINMKNKNNLNTLPSSDKESQMANEKELIKKKVLKTKNDLKDTESEQGKKIDKDTNLKITDCVDKKSLKDEEERTGNEAIKVAKEKKKGNNKKDNLKFSETKEKESIEIEAIIASEQNKKLGKNLNIQERNGKEINTIEEATGDESQIVVKEQSKRVNKKASLKKGESNENKFIDDIEKVAQEDNLRKSEYKEPQNVAKEKTKIANKKANLKISDCKKKEYVETVIKETTMEENLTIPKKTMKVSQKKSMEQNNKINKIAKESLVDQEDEEITKDEHLKMPEVTGDEPQKVTNVQTKRISKKSSFKTAACIEKESLKDEKLNMEENLIGQEMMANDSQKVVKKQNKRTTKNVNLKMPENFLKDSLEAKEKELTNEDDLKIDLPGETDSGSRIVAKVQNVKSMKTAISLKKENIEKISLQTNVRKEILIEENINPLENPVKTSQKLVREQRKRVNRNTYLEISEIQEEEFLEPERKEESPKEALKRPERNRKICLEVKGRAEELNTIVQNDESTRTETTDGKKGKRNKIDTKENFEIVSKNEKIHIDEKERENSRIPQSSISKPAKGKRSKPTCNPDTFNILENTEKKENLNILSNYGTISNNLRTLHSNNKEFLDTVVESLDDNVMTMKNTEINLQNGRKRTTKNTKIKSLEPEDREMKQNRLNNVEININLDEKVNIVENKKMLHLKENKNAINVKEMINILESRSVEKKSLKEKRKGTNNKGENIDTIESSKKGPVKGKIVESILENFKILENSEAEKQTLKVGNTMRNIKPLKDLETEQSKKVGKSKKVKAAVESDKENYVGEAEIDAQLHQSVNVRPSRRCKTKASEAIAKAMNDSL